jgi:hypothetical protein
MCSFLGTRRDYRTVLLWGPGRSWNGSEAEAGPKRWVLISAKRAEDRSWLWFGVEGNDLVRAGGKMRVEAIEVVGNVAGKERGWS